MTRTKVKLPPATEYFGEGAADRRYADLKRIQEGLVPIHMGGPPRLAPGDIAAIGAAAAAALRAALRENTPSRTPAPPPRTPADNDGDSGDAWADRSTSLLGSFAKTAPTYYSVDQLANNPEAMGQLFSPRRYV